MKKRILVISVMVLVLVLALFAFSACDTSETEVGVELVKNGDFSAFNDKRFDGWEFVSSVSNDRYGQVESSDGEYLHIGNTSSSSFSYLKQAVKVETNQVYLVTFKVKIDTKLANKNGAYVSFAENFEYKFSSRTEATDGFVEHSFYIRPKNTDYLTISLALDGSGDVWFDNISVVRVDKDSIPANADVTDFRKSRTDKTSSDTNGIVFTVLLTMFSVCAVVTAYIIIRRVYADRHAFNDFGVVTDSAKIKSSTGVKWYQNSWFICAMIGLGTLLLRLVFICTMYGMGSEMTSTLNLARNTLALKDGVVNFMAKNASSQYAPGELYILAIIGAMTKSANINTASIVLRLINALADVVTVSLIFFYGKKHVGNKLATVYACLYSLLPISFFMGGLNASFESVLVALMVASIILMTEKKYLATYFVMTLAAVLDIRALAVAPIIVAYFGYMYVKDNESLKKFTANRAKIVFGLIATVVLAYLLTLPVGINQIAKGDAFFNFKVMVGEIINVNYYTLNAFNLYGMVAMNRRSAVQGVKILNLVFLLVLEAYGISLYFKNRNRQELLLIASFALAVIGVFTIKVTYTYLFLSLALGLMFTMVSGDKRMYGVLGALASLNFLNVAQLMNQSGFVAAHPTGSIVDYETKNPFFIAFSVITILVMGYYAYVCYSITNNGKIVDITAMPESLSTTVKNWFAGVGARLKDRKGKN